MTPTTDPAYIAAVLDTYAAEMRKAVALCRDTQRRIAGVEAAMRLGERHPVPFVSQFCEDVLIWDAFGRRMHGTFIEAGAFDGVRYSATYALERMGWHGVAFEPNPDMAAALAKNRAESMSVALGSAVGEAGFRIADDAYGGMLSHVEGAGFLPSGRTTRSVRVPVETLAKVIASIGGVVDVLVLDVEGREVDALRGVDWHSPNIPRLMLIEDMDTANDSALVRYLADKPYLILAEMFAHNRVCIRSDQADLIEHFRWFGMAQ